VADRDSSAYHADRREYVDEFLAYHSHISRALTEGLSAQQSDDEFNATIDAAIASIFAASRT
jgi:fructose-bisphosphate aldolase class I